METLATVLSLARRSCLALACIAFSATAHGLDAVEALANSADAIVVVEVAFVPYGDLVLVHDVVRGEPAGLSNAGELLGDCLPGKATVRSLAASATGAQADIYNEALQMAAYTAVIFVQNAGDASSAICGDAIDSTENWHSDPRYPAWRNTLDAYLDRRG